MGDQRGIAEETQEAMRASGLGHILSISGLHMALVAGSVFWLIRALLALSPALALDYPIKKWAAAGALVVATFYLGISGAEVATVRSYVMLAIMLVAVMLDRRALTLRNVALAALVILVFSPESLLSISFQMSFAATVALIATYEALSARADRKLDLADATGSDAGSAAHGRRSSTLFLTSLVAGLATAPFGAFYFQRVAPLTIVANMAVAPAVGFVVMPMALLSVVAHAVRPRGAAADRHAMGSRVDGRGRRDDRGVVGRRGAASARCRRCRCSSSSPGFLWLALWRERWRLAGIVPIVARAADRDARAAAGSHRRRRRQGRRRPRRRRPPQHPRRQGRELRGRELAPRRRRYAAARRAPTSTRRRLRRRSAASARLAGIGTVALVHAPRCLRGGLPGGGRRGVAAAGAARLRAPRAGHRPRRLDRYGAHALYVDGDGGCRDGDGIPGSPAAVHAAGAGE